MNDLRNEKLGEYYEAAGSWAEDRQEAIDRSRKTAWIVAGVALGLALLEAIALILLIPLKREVPYTLLVDRQTGFVEALKPLQQQSLTPDDALTSSFLVQYVIAREGFDAATLQDNYRKVGLWSAGSARDSYVQLMQPTNPLSPLATLPRAATLEVRIRSVSSLAVNRALIRFDTVRSDQGSSKTEIQNWAAIIDYRFNDASMSAQDRLDNPLGFQDTRNRKDPETMPVDEETAQTPAGNAPAGPGQ